jgi:hypothetical protein
MSRLKVGTFGGRYYLQSDHTIIDFPLVLRRPLRHFIIPIPDVDKPTHRVRKVKRVGESEKWVTRPRGGGVKKTLVKKYFEQTRMKMIGARVK